MTTIDDGLLYRKKRGKELITHRVIVVQQNRRTRLLALAHGSPYSAHLGRMKTLDKLARKLHWPGMTTDVCELVLSP